MAYRCDKCKQPLEAEAQWDKLEKAYGWQYESTLKYYEQAKNLKAQNEKLEGQRNNLHTALGERNAEVSNLEAETLELALAAERFEDGTGFFNNAELNMALEQPTIAKLLEVK